MPSPYSTKRARAIPDEFADFFIRHGWTRCNNVFGKNATLKYYHALGGERLTAARRAVKARPACSDHSWQRQW